MDASRENVQALRLVQALIGSVGPNFRRVTLEMKPDGGVSLRFLLEGVEPRDKEEIEEVAFEFEALQETDIQVDVHVVVDARPFEEIHMPGRAVYGRRE